MKRSGNIADGKSKNGCGAPRAWVALVRLPDAPEKTFQIAGARDKVFGLSAREFVKNPDRFASLLHPEDLPRVLSFLAKLPVAGRGGCSYRVRHADGRYHRWHEESCWVASSNGQPVKCVGCAVRIAGRQARASERRLARARLEGFVLGCLKDGVTPKDKLELHQLDEELERRVAQRTESLRQSEKRFQTLADATFEGVVLSQSGIIIDCNQQFLDILARPREDIIGCSIAEFVPVDRVEEVMNGILAGADVIKEQALVRPDGSQRIVEVRGYSPDGPAGTRFSIFRDVTEQRDLERELILQRERLARFQRMAELSAMSAGVLHQAGQPLTAVFNNISAAATAVSECSNPSCIAPEAIQDSLRCLKGVQRTIARLRSLTHPDRAHREWADLNELVREVLGLLKSEIKSHGVRVNLCLAADLPPVSLDDVQLSQALLNVVRNACEAMIDCPPSERVLTIGTRTLRPGWVELCVTDQGSGITSEHTDRIFEPFFTTKPGGMGVGLSLCQAVVEAHGGNLTAGNNSDAPGATFYFHLPAGEGERS